MVEQLREAAKQITKNTRPSPGAEDSMQTAEIAMLMIGMTVHPEPINRFWSLLSIEDAIEKTQVINRILPDVQSDGGPLFSLHALALEQAESRYSPGNWFDRYHIQYIPLVDELLTSDRRLLDLCHRQPEGSRLVTRVKHAREFIEQVVREVRSPIASPPKRFIITTAERDATEVRHMYGKPVR
jgi:hypothetical protein